MKYREIEIYAPKDIGAAGVEVIDLNMVDPLAAIFITFRTTVNTVSDMLASHPECISKIEIVDGSDVLFSLSGQQSQIRHFARTGMMPLNDITVVAADVMTSVIPILFGRHLYDMEYLFDPNRFKSPQLKITWDEDAANTGVVGNELTVRGIAIEDSAVSPVGFLMCKELKSFTPVASSHDYTDLPTDYPYTMLMLQAYSTDKNPFEVIGGLKLSEDHDKRIPFDLTGYELFRNYNQFDGSLIERVRLNETAGDAMALYLSPTYLHNGQMNMDADVVAANDDFTQLAFANNKVTIAATVNYVPYLLTIQGFAPFSGMWWKFGNINDPNHFYDVAGLNNLRLDYQGAAAVGTSPNTKIFAEQVRPY